jgi:hypothetical protein
MENSYCVQNILRYTDPSQHCLPKNWQNCWHIRFSILAPTLQHAKKRRSGHKKGLHLQGPQRPAGLCCECIYKANKGIRLPTSTDFTTLFRNWTVASTAASSPSCRSSYNWKKAHISTLQNTRQEKKAHGKNREGQQKTRNEQPKLN